MTSPKRIAPFPPRTDKNPYQRLLYEHLARYGFETVADGRLELGWLVRSRERVSFLHFHWDELYYESTGGLRSWCKLAGFALKLRVARALGYRLVWTVHEVHPQETRSRRRDLAAGRVLVRACNLVIAHDEATAARARAVLGAGSVEVVPHGSYVGVYPPGRPRAAVRAELGLPEGAFVFLCFGHLRRYKQLELLLAAFAALERDDAALVVAGQVAWRVQDVKWEEDTLALLHRAVTNDPRIKLLLEFVPDERVAELYGAADAAVLARGDGWTSGSLVLALSLGVPVVAARAPAYVALIGENEAGWLFEPDDADSLRGAMLAAMSEPEAKGVEARRRADALDWEQIAARTAELMLDTL